MKSSNSSERQSAPTGAQTSELKQEASRPLGVASCSDSSILEPRTGRLSFWRAFQRYWENGGEASCNDIYQNHGGLKAAVEEGFIQALIQHGNLTTGGSPSLPQANLRVSFDLEFPASILRQSEKTQPYSVGPYTNRTRP